MTDAVQIQLQHALALTMQMSDAAGQGNWTLVNELDTQRQLHLQQIRHDSLTTQHHEALQALQAHNRTLLARAEQVRETVEQQLSQHQYNHRALRSYVSSSC